MKRRRTILLIEDNRKLLGTIRRVLQLKGYVMRTSVNMAGARRALEEFSPDLIVLDILLSDGNGIDFCREMREYTDVPVLFLSALDRTMNVIDGLRAGGDDYMTKPFDFDELEARIEVLLRRSEKAKSEARQDDLSPEVLIDEPRADVGPLLLDSVSRCVRMRDTEVHLSPTEFSMLNVLAQNMGRYVPIREIYRAVWGMEPGADLRTVKQCAYNLRNRFGRYGLDSFIRLEQKRGAGYRLKIESPTPETDGDTL